VFLRFVKKRLKHGIEEYAQIAQKYREDGKQKTRI
jgi:t-SNARE complex subunit (syntaxin)